MQSEDGGKNSHFAAYVTLACNLQGQREGALHTAPPVPCRISLAEFPAKFPVLVQAQSKL